MKVPTEKQFKKLSVLGIGVVALAPGRGEWGPLLRRGWVETVSEDDADRRYLPPVQITPEGLRAVAAYIERNPLPAWGEGEKPKQVDEPPTITRLKAEIAELKTARDTAYREAYNAKSTLRRIAREVERVQP